MGKVKRRRSRHRKKKGVEEQISSSSSEGSDSSSDSEEELARFNKRKRPKRPSIIPKDAPPDVGNDDLYPARETRFKDWDAHILANLEYQRDLGLSQPDKERWDKALDEMMLLRRVYNERRRTGRDDLKVSGIMADKSVQTNEVGLVPGVEFADAAVQINMEVNEGNSGNVKVPGQISIWVDEIGDEEEGNSKPQLPDECNLNVGAQERLEGVNHATVGDNNVVNCPVAEGSRRQNAVSVSIQSEEANQGKSGMSSVGPSTSSHVPETEVASFNRSQRLGQSVNGSHVSHNVIHPEFYERLQLSCRTLGHRSAVFCVLFDVTGKFVFTGADDKLVKIWSAVDGRLLATLRGASSEISDLAVNNENTLLAAGGWDKLIHVWYLRTCAPVTVLNVHSRTITTLFFCPIPRSRHSVAYLASTSSDGSCSFWGFTENQETGQIEFEPRPTHYQERMRPGPAQIFCSSFSSGGIFMAAGSADNNVRVYHMLGHKGPERILEAEYHTGRVDSISWAHEGLRFISGSKDGTALVWRFESGEWRHVRLFCAKVLESNLVRQKGPKRRIAVERVAWNTDDTLVITAVSDNLVKVWNPLNGELIRILDWHNAFTLSQDFVIESHPFNPRIILTAGYDGEIIISDIGTLNKEEKGKIVFQHHNRLDQRQGRGGGAVYDCKWAPDGLSLAATDSRGHLLLFTTQKKADSKFAKLPGELFFHTDYKALKRDPETNEVLDEQTQVPPHLMPPPFLVNMEGNPYPPDLQRLVPGREKCREEQLIPKVVVGDGGVQEVSVDLSNYGFSERNVIMPLSKEELAKSEEERLRFADKEETVYKENISRRPASSPSEYGSVNMVVPSEEDTSDDDITTSSSSSSSSDSDSDPEWVGSKRGEENRNNRAAPEGSRKSTRKSNLASPHSEGANQQEDSDGEPQPGPSSAAMVGPSASKSPSEPKNKSTKPEEIPPQYRPSKWLAEMTPKRTPYFPQIGDEVVYYRHGHQNYVAEVEKQKLYEINGEQKKLLPFIAYPDLETSVPARVMKVEFEIKPPRVVTIQLTLLERYTGEYSGPNLSVTYHDMANVVDFIILRQIHDKYIRQDWNVGERFRCLLPDSCCSRSYWWVGTIASIEAKDRNFPDSKFLCYNVLWDNRESDKLSPWDLDAIPDSFDVPLEGQAISASEEDQRIGLYQASPADWLPHGDQDAQCAKLSRLIQQVMSLRVSEAFLAPVDLKRYPEYASQIEYPMDLSTIKARLDNCFYRRVDSLKFDVQYITMNAIKFHLEDSDIGKNAKIVTDLCNELITNPDLADVNPVYHQIVQRHWKEAQKNKTNKLSSSSIVSASTPRSASRSASTSQPQPSTSRSWLRNITKPTGRAGTDNSDEEEDTRNWRDRCRDLVQLIYQTKDAVPFRTPVNPEEYPDYFQHIETPMDLQSVIEDLSGGNYNSPNDFHKDMNLIFSNSRRYNTDRSSQIYGMTKRLQMMYENQVQPILTSYRRDKKDKSLSSPSNSQKKRIIPTRTSMASTPRKNSVRNASSQSLHAESGTSSEDEQEGGNRRYFTKASHHNESETSSSRQSRKRTSSTSTSSSTPNRSMTVHSPRNGRTTRER